MIACLGAAWQGSASMPVAEAGEKAPGDIDCDDDVDSVDALKVLRHTAGLTNQQPGGCPEIGSARLGSQGAMQGPGSMTAMSVDMALFGNSPTSVLSIQPCAQLNANGIQDAEETAVDTLTFDVTAQIIPVAYPLVGFGYVLSYDSSTLNIQTHDPAYMLVAKPDSVLFDASDPVPDATGDFDGTALDIGPLGVEETGSGVLGRLTISATETAQTGTYPLALSFNAHISYTGDPNKPTEAWTPVTTNNGMVSINQPCAVASTNGDVDCDGDVDSVDALRILREVAALPNELPIGCPPIS